MTDEEIAVKLTLLEHESKSAKHRLNDLEMPGMRSPMVNGTGLMVLV
ncbi:MAG: hypothetical protein QM657_18720 [Lacrimispora sp.]